MKSKITIYLFIMTVFSMLSCQNIDENKQTENTLNDGSGRNTNEIYNDEQNSEVGEKTDPDLPSSKYFEVTDILQGKYLDNSKFKAEVLILNKTDFKFKNFQLSAKITYKMKNENITCERSAQYNEIEPRVIESWLPHTKKKFQFTIDHHGQLGCLNINYERTPESIQLVLEPFIKAVSIDVETEGAFAIYDILPQWKEKQIKEGLR